MGGPATFPPPLHASALLLAGGQRIRLTTNPMEAILLSIPLDQEKRLDAVEKVLQNAGAHCEVAARMDSRPLPQSMRDDALADRAESVALPFERYSFAPGSRLQGAAQRKTTELRTRLTERTDLWLNASAAGPRNFLSPYPTH